MATSASTPQMAAPLPGGERRGASLPRSGARPARLKDAAPGWRRARLWLARALDRYPELPPALAGRSARIGHALVAAMALAFTIFYAVYLFTQHDAYQTHAEDMGIMTQALWNTLHGAPLHQTVCNIVGDSNCLGDISRFAIHFEPLLLPLAMIYRLAPSPKTLQLLQAAIVACGAFPAYWLASRRLRSVVAGVIFAGVYLLYPALQAAITFDFHAVTLSAAFLMFALYFMLARNNIGLLVACVLALATKEEIVVDVAMIGLSIALLQRRWRLGLGMVALTAAWLVVELAIMRVASPLGHSPTAGRYAALGSSPLGVAHYLLTHPVTVIHRYVLEPQHQYYLRSLLAPVAYLPLLSPLTLAIAVPALAINLLSGDPSMYSGVYQYNAEIIPVLILAAVESVALLAGIAGALARVAAPRAEGLLWRRPRLGSRAAVALRSRTAARMLLLGLVGVLALMSLRAQRLHGYTPLTQGFQWPVVTAHDRIGDELLRLIPPNASVSAQSDLVPHLSNRRYVYLFPYAEHEADYILLDVTGNIYPQLADPAAYADGVRALLASGRYSTIAARDGYLLLKRQSPVTNLPDPANPSTDAPALPASFYSFATVAPSQVPHPLDVRFGPSLELVGYEMSSAEVYLNNPFVTVTTYWRALGPIADDPRPELVLTPPDGSQAFDSRFAATQWLPMARWQPGNIYAVRSWPQLMNGSQVGTVRLGTWVLADAPDASAPQPLPIQRATGSDGQSLPRLRQGAIVVFANLHVAS